MTYFEISAQVIYVIFKNSWDEVATPLFHVDLPVDKLYML